jgi:hypothetical protein
MRQSVLGTTQSGATSGDLLVLMIVILARDFLSDRKDPASPINQWADLADH